MKTTTAKALTSITTSLAVLLLTGCGPAPIPVQAEVEWEGRNTGQFEDDPRVEVVREYVVQLYAAANALNYSDPALTEIASNLMIARPASGAATSIAMAPVDSAILWEGPPSFTVTDVVKRKRDKDTFEVRVCQRLAPHWTLAPSDTIVGNGTVQEAEGVYRIEQEHFVVHYYSVWKSPTGWIIDSEGGSSEKCEPTDDFAVGTYTTPPDIDLLRQATPDMVIGPDGKRVAD